jgi:hypothetical protein
MRKINILMAIMLFATAAFAQLNEGWQLGTVPDDYATNPYPKKEYTVYFSDAFDFETQSLDDIWGEAGYQWTAGSIGTLFILDDQADATKTDKVPATNAADLSGEFQVFWDYDNIYILLKVTDDVYVAGTDAIEVEIAPYIELDAADWPISFSSDLLSPKQKFAYWTAAGGLKIGFKNGESDVAIVYDNYAGVIREATTDAKGGVGWGAANDLGLDGKFVAFSATEYHYVCKIPLTTALAGFGPMEGDEISLNVSIYDGDGETAGDGAPQHHQSTWNSDNNNVYCNTFYCGKGIISEEPLGIEEVVAGANYSVFVNQANELVVNDAAQIESISINNVIGQEVKTFSTVENRLQLGNLTNGIYIVKLQAKNGKVYSQKVLVK